ncbi:MAG: glycosyl hydrolase 115 family protein [Planctomycetales bacterium]|nr:glycosyl hydrolase 115 family protein [Planctomycetales bacterium]
MNNIARNLTAASARMRLLSVHRRNDWAWAFVTVLLWSASTAEAISPPSQPPMISTSVSENAFPLARAGRPAALIVDSADWPGVLRVATLLQADLSAVVGAEPQLLPIQGVDEIPPGQPVVLVGTLGRSAIVDALVDAGAFDPTGLRDKKEKFIIESVVHPLPGVDRALVVAGSDKRGTIFGLFELAAQAGVSPWHWWADVPVTRQENLSVLPGRHTLGEPAVEFRGIFINDEAPALAGWAHEKFGGCNSKFYEHVFQLILRLRGNYLWPAMWGRSLFDDDPASQQLADEYGVVIGTSHHEPMMRAHVEWERYGEGPWNYEKNQAVLRNFWAEGIRRMGDCESVVTIGMRGDGDEPMAEQANIALLERIVADQRAMIAEVTNKPAPETPQCWALYKEVQEYYDRGMRVPDDVMLLLCDDNWGNIRKLPALDSARRPGGYGIYYHFDYVGGPRNYKWLNTNPLPRIWEQMHLADAYGARRLWIVNVGDIKPMEFPISFFLDYAWNPAAWSHEHLGDYARSWAAQQFGPEQAEEIADLLTKYAKYNSRRKPELIAPETYSLVNFGEADRVVAEWRALAERARRVAGQLPADLADAYFQLVLHPIEACANLNELYVTVAKNRLYAAQGRTETNALADRAAELFARDAEISRQYNEEIAAGKWRHMMDQTHIGYTSWQEPPRNVMPQVERLDGPPDGPAWGIAVEGSRQWHAPDDAPASLPPLNQFGAARRWIDVFARGSAEVSFTATTSQPWLSVSPNNGTTGRTKRLQVAVDWAQAPTGDATARIQISANGAIATVNVTALRPPAPPEGFVGFLEADGFVSINAADATEFQPGAQAVWTVIEDLGRTGSAVSPLPANVPQQLPGDGAPCLQYSLLLAESGPVDVHIYASPTQDFTFTNGLEFAVSFDDQPPRRVNLQTDPSASNWNEQVANNANRMAVRLDPGAAGRHVLKVWMVDPGVVVQKLVVARGPLPESYLGPPPSARFSPND